MKKTLKNWLLPVVVAASAVLCWHCQQVPQPNTQDHQAQMAAATVALTPHTPTFSPGTLSSASSAYQFPITGLPTLAPKQITNPPTPFWRVFLNFGDGTFWMGTKDLFDASTFAYEKAGAYDSYIETTPCYDDNQNPVGVGRAAPTTINVVNTGTPTTVAMGTSAVKLQCNREPRPGDPITYIVTYQNNGTTATCGDSINGSLDFRYDSNILTFDSVEPYNSELPLSGSANSSNNTGMVKLKFYKLKPSEQRSVFLRFTVNSDKTTADSMVIKPQVSMIAERSVLPTVTVEKCTISGQDTLNYQRLVDSHDPNHKFALGETACLDANSVTFTVTFQNNGEGPTNTVVVEDELDVLLKNEEPTLISWSTPKPPDVDMVTPNSTDRTVRFDFGSLVLHGLAEVGYGKTFGEEDTKATFTFRCAIDPTAKNYRCGAILNRAQVTFDCNPVIETDLAFQGLLCVDCDTTCTTVLDTLFPLVLPGDSVVSPNLITQMNSRGFNSSNSKFKWYPEEGLSDPFVQSPELLQGGKTHNIYTLVASQPCRRAVFTFVRTCNLQISVDASNVQYDACTHTASGTITATAMGAQGPATNLQWPSCIGGVAQPNHIGASQTVTITDPNKLQYFFAVTDPETGCTAEITYTLKFPPCKTKPWWWTLNWAVLTAVLVAVLGFWGYRMWRKR